jgi:hypothetical protein
MEVIEMKKIILMFLILNCVGCVCVDVVSKAVIEPITGYKYIGPKTFKERWNTDDERFLAMNDFERSARDVAIFQSADGPSAYNFTHHHLQPNSFWVLDRYGRPLVILSPHQYEQEKRKGNVMSEPQYVVKPYWFVRPESSYGIK